MDFSLKMEAFKWILLLTMICICDATSFDDICKDNQLLCGDGKKCIAPTALCDHNPDCQDMSDEINFNLCKKIFAHVGLCGSGTKRMRCNSQQPSYANLRNQCFDIITACALGSNCLSSSDMSICEEITDNILEPGLVSTEPELKMEPQLTKEESNFDYGKILVFLRDAYNETISRNFTICPPLYTPFRDECFSFFSPAKVTWSEAKRFCESTSGRLAVLSDIHRFKTVLDYIGLNELKSDFWIGGHLDNSIKTNDNASLIWTWINGKPIEMGTPFWSLSFEDPRRTHRCSEITKSLRPRGTTTGELCVALLKENQYYFSDESCNRKLSPLCTSI